MQEVGQKLMTADVDNLGLENGQTEALAVLEEKNEVVPFSRQPSCNSEL